MSSNTLLNIDVLVVDGQSIAIEGSTAELIGAAGFENEVVPSATGDDFQKRKRIPRSVKAKLQFGPAVDPADFAKHDNIQITGRDSVSGRRVLLPKCSFKSMGNVGQGSVDIEWNVLSAPQWL